MDLQSPDLGPNGGLFQVRIALSGTYRVTPSLRSHIAQWMISCS
jgi:hypothetical protein